jgi:hypothetical protein
MASLSANPASLVVGRLRHGMVLGPNQPIRVAEQSRRGDN